MPGKDTSVKTILMVEDEPLIALSEKSSLEKYGYKIITLQTGEDSVGYIEKNEDIDLVLMDVDLGDGIDGTQAAEAILRIRPIPVIFLSSHTEPEIVEKTEKITSFGYVVKNTGTTILDASIKMAFRLFEADKNYRNEMNGRKRAHDELDLERSLYRDLVNSLPTGVYRLRIIAGKPWKENEWVEKVESNYRLEMVSDLFCSIIGASREQITQNSKTVVDHIHPDDRESFIKKNIQALGKVETFFWEGRVVKNGNTVCVQFVTVPRKLDNGDLICTGMIMDISERKQTEETLQKNREHLEFIADNIPALIAYVDSSQNYIYVNKPYAEWYGRRKEDIIGKQISDILPVASYKGILKHFDTVMKGEKLTFENVSYDTEGNLRAVRASYIPHIEAEGEVKAFIGMVEDITDNKIDEETIKLQLIEKETLLKEVHHRIKNNISSIGNLLKLQAAAVSNEEAEKILYDTIGRVDSMGKIYDKLLLSDDFRELPVKTYLEELIASLLDVGFNKKKITLNVSIDNFTMKVNELFPLGVIINEIITNSIKYSFTDMISGNIDLSLTKKGPLVSLIIRDNGKGLPENFCIDTVSGFGLVLVKSFVKQLEGTFQLVSDNGVLFQLEFTQELLD